MSHELKNLCDQLNVTVRRKIAEGGMGAIYEADQNGAEGFVKTVAVKTIIEDIAADREFINMFIGEAKLVADLIHQNIVQVYHLGKLDGAYYIVMEYVPGINLEQLLDRHRDVKKRIPVELCAFIASRACRGLEYAHNKTDRHGQKLGVVHRDISPKNIMITGFGEVKITDFGIAKAHQLMQDREGEVLMGKVQYMSPEQASFEQTDCRSDVFSLGVVLWELLAGRELFQDESTTAVLESVKSAPLPDIEHYCPEIPPMLKKILAKSLERDLGKRYQDAGKMGYDLEYFMYHKGYGPTIQTLEKYMLKIFPELAQPAGKIAEKDEVGFRADTVLLGGGDG